MLRPFQLRNLHGYPIEDGLPSSPNRRSISRSNVNETRRKLSGFIQLSAPEYDDITRGNPNAMLTYIDDDDGDIITVGSSLELEQRLDEPTQNTGIIWPSQTKPLPIHLFDIRRSKSVIDLWKEVERNSALQHQNTLDNVSQSGTTEVINSSNPSEDGNSSKIRELDGSKTMDMRQQWFEASRPPQLSLNKNSETVTQDSVVRSVESTVLPTSEKQSSSTTTSSCAITEEGRRQAQEAGHRFRNLWNIPTGSQIAPDFIRNQENPWALPTEAEAKTKTSDFTSTKPQISLRETKSSQTEANTEPLLSAFEAEMARILEEDANDRADESTHSSISPPPESHTHRNESGEQAWPVNLVTDILQTVAGGIENLGAELKLKIPEVERRLANARRAVPEDVSTKMWSALTTVEAQIQNLAQVIQSASDASGEAAERVRSADLRSAEQVVSDLGNMAHEFEDFGKTLFAAFESEFGQGNNTEPNITNPTVPEQDANPTQAQTRAEDTSVSTKPLHQTPEEANTSQESLNKTQDAVTETASTTFYQRPPPPHPTSSLPPQITNQSLPNSQSQTANIRQEDSPEQPLFSNWPNRPAFVPASKPIVNQPRVGVREENTTEKPLFSNWPNRPAFVPPSGPRSNRSQVNHVHQDAGTWWRGYWPREPPASSAPVNELSSLSSEPMPTGSHPDVPVARNDEIRVGDSSKSLFMGNIGFEVTEKIIEEVFASQHFSVKVSLPTDSSTGKHAGFGYAHFQSTSAAKAALSRLQGVVIDGHSLNLEHCDNSPIDDLQTQTPVSQPAPVSSDASHNRTLRYRHSWQPGWQSGWQPGTLAPREHRPLMVPSNDSLPSIFSGNARSNVSRATRPDFNREGTLVEENTFQNHPEESPEFAARYPSLLPSFRSQDHPANVPKRSMTLSPNSEIARFPPVSQLDAHLLANQRRSEELPERKQVRSEFDGVPSVKQVATDRAAHRASQRGTREHVSREPRRIASAVNRRSPHESQRNLSGVHGLRRRATEAAPLRQRAHENSFREARPTSFYDKPTDTLPGSFPADDAPAPTTNDGNTSSERELKTALRQSTIDDCVDNLMRFGYNTQIDGGRGRLSVYAEAAGGDVSEAIDMIEEDKSAYRRYLTDF